MKRQIKSISKIVTVLLFLTFSACQKDDVSEINPETTNKNAISLAQFKQETKIKNFSKILKLSVSEKNSKDESELSDFYIDTEVIQKCLATNNKTTYSFVIYHVSENKIPNQIFNLVYHKENNVWEQSIFLMTKKLITNYNQNIYQNIENIYNSNKTTNKTTNKIGEMCISEFYSILCDGSCKKANYLFCDGWSCPTGQCITRTISFSDCSSAGSSGSNGTGTGSNDPVYSGGTNGTNSNPYEFTPNMFENPVYNDPNYINACKAEYFFNYLQDFEKTWANQNVTTYNEIINYLIQNQWSSDSKNFANEMINLSATNNLTFTFDSTLNSTNTINFNNVNAIQNYLTTNLNSVNNQTINQQGETISMVKFQINNIGTKLLVIMKQKLIPYRLTNLKTELEGITSFLENNLIDYSVNTIHHTSTPDTIEINIYNSTTFNITVYGYGVRISKTIHIAIIIDSTNGVIITSYIVP